MEAGNEEGILQEAHRLTNRDRRETYGHPLDDFIRVAGIFNSAFSHKLKEPMTAEEMMLVLVMVKISRQIHSQKRDNLVDICGYANCIQMAVEERTRRECSADVADTAAKSPGQSQSLG